MDIEYKCKFQVSGKVLEIGETQTFSSGFQKRTVVVEASKDAEKFSNPVELTLKKDECPKADGLRVGDGVAAEGFVEGRRWEKDGKTRFFIDLSVKSLIVTGKAELPTTAKTWKELVALGAAYGEDKDRVTERAKSLGKPFKDMIEADWVKLAAEIVAANATTQGEGEPDDEDIPF